jgi:zinc transport system permease protein
MLSMTSMLSMTAMTSILGSFLEMFEYEFMRRAIYAGLLASVVFGIIGSYVVVKRIVFIAGGIAHASFGGVGLSFYLEWDRDTGPIIGAALFALASALGIGVLNKETLEREETTIGIVWAVGMALGALFIAMTPGYAISPSSYLFGNILFLKSLDLQLLSILVGIVIISTILLYHKLQATAFDEEFSTVVGIHTTVLHLYYLCLVALTIVLLIKFLGVILVLAMLTIPASLVGRFTHDLRWIMFFSSILSGIFIIGGLWTSFIWDTATGATIVIESAIIYLVVVLFHQMRKRIRSLLSRSKVKQGI